MDALKGSFGKGEQMLALKDKACFKHSWFDTWQMTQNMNVDAVKEPRGFIKVLQWVLSILAFATTTSVNTSIRFTYQCLNTTTVTENSIKISYPFSLSNLISAPFCADSGKSLEDLGPSPKSSAEFYVFVGVIVFLYCLAALVLYVFFDEVYRKYNAVTIADFVISIILCALWLISSAAWAQGVVDLKYYTNLDESGEFQMFCKGITCKQTLFPNLASLNASIIFGFLNMFVWGANLWFLYKETPWFKVSAKPPTSPNQAGQPEFTDPQKI